MGRAVIFGWLAGRFPSGGFGSSTFDNLRDVRAFGFERGLNRRFKEAPFFYGSFAFIIIISMLIVLIPGVPLFPIMILSQAMNAILLPLILFLILKIANDPVIMGKYKNSKLTNILAYSLTVMITLITAVLIVEPFLNG